MSSFPPQGPPPQGPPPGPPGGYGPPPGQPAPGYGAPPQPGYGAAPGYGPQPAYGAPPGGGSNGLAIGALVCGIIALISFWTIFGGIVFGLIALILGIMGRKKANENGVGGGMAIAGLVMGILGLLGGLLFGAFTVWFVSSVDQQLQEEFGTGFGDLIEDSTLCSQGDQAACDRLGVPNPLEQ